MRFGLAFGLALGVVVVGGFEFMDDRLHTEKGIKALLPMKVLFEIPEVLTPWDELKARNRMLLRWGMTALVFATILVGSAFSYLHN